MPRPKHAYPLTTGEVVSVYGAVKDSRNVHKASRTCIRNRLRAGIKDPEILWAPPIRIPMNIYIDWMESRRNKQ